MGKATRRRFLTQSGIGLVGSGTAGLVLRSNMLPTLAIAGKTHC